MRCCTPCAARATRCARRHSVIIARSERSEAIPSRGRLLGVALAMTVEFKCRSCRRRRRCRRRNPGRSCPGRRPAPGRDRRVEGGERRLLALVAVVVVDDRLAEDRLRRHAAEQVAVVRPEARADALEQQRAAGDARGRCGGLAQKAAAVAGLGERCHRRRHRRRGRHARSRCPPASSTPLAVGAGVGGAAGRAHGPAIGTLPRPPRKLVGCGGALFAASTCCSRPSMCRAPRPAPCPGSAPSACSGDRARRAARDALGDERLGVAILGQGAGLVQAVEQRRATRSRSCGVMARLAGSKPCRWG